MEDITRRGFILGSLAGFLFPKHLFASTKLNLRYISLKNKLCLRIIARKNESYASISNLYTGSEKYTNAIKDFNDNRPVRIGGPVYMPINYLRKSLTKVLEENDFLFYEIDSQGEGGISTISELAAEFLSDKLDLNEKIAIIIIINTDINPFTAIVYNGQKILVPKSLVRREMLISEKRRSVTQIIYEPTATPGKARQNPLRVPLTSITRNLEERDKFGARRIRTGWHGNYKVSRHTGLDLSAPIGTNLYPIESGRVRSAGNFGGRNGKGVRYATNSGLEVVYIHMSKVMVAPGQRIDLNTVVGKVGITGNASADNPHVHVQIRKNGRIVDPAPYVLK